MSGDIRPSIHSASGAKIYTVGDSTTHGAVSDGMGGFNYYGSWRCAWFAALTAAGKSPNFVGTLLNSADGVVCAGTAHSGYNGSTAANWAASYFGPDAASVQGTYGDPDIVAIALGANDGNLAGGVAVGDLIVQAKATFPNCLVLVSTMWKIGTTYDVMNAEIRSQVAAKQKLGLNVALVEQENAFGGSTSTAYLSDGLHPTQSGYAMLAAAWIAASVSRINP